MNIKYLLYIQKVWEPCGNITANLIDVQRLYRAINKVKPSQFEDELSKKLSEAFSNKHQKMVFFHPFS